MLLEAHDIQKSIGEKLLFDIPEWYVYENDRIGIVGRNGTGKTMLLNILAGKTEPDTGWIKINGQAGFIEQLPDDGQLGTMSGGEKTREQIRKAFETGSGLIFADEPTSHLDINGRKYLEKQIGQFSGAVLIVSHDRMFLDNCCNRIAELENGRLQFYSGNYSDYQKQKVLEIKALQDDHEAYEKEKKRLKKAMEETRKKSEGIKTAPKRMGNSEARLHKMGGQNARKTLDNAVKNYEKRIEHLEEKKKPVIMPPVSIQLDKGREIYNPVLISGTNVTKKIESKLLFKNADFQLFNHSRTALKGANGSGKTTLINMILNKENGIHLAKNVYFGYFSQSLDLLKEDETILENVMEKSVHNESFVRMLLARLLFKGQDVHKKVEVLSGGEKNKVSLALLLVSDANVLIFDEPTNYLDIASMEAVEEAMKAYQGTILFVSHDERFVEQVATHIWEIDHKKIKSSVAEQESAAIEPGSELNLQADKERLLLLENRLNSLIGKLSFPDNKMDNSSELEKEYQETLNEISQLKEKSSGE